MESILFICYFLRGGVLFMLGARDSPHKQLEERKKPFSAG
jgi:hypothetical protein